MGMARMALPLFSVSTGRNPADLLSDLLLIPAESGNRTADHPDFCEKVFRIL